MPDAAARADAHDGFGRRGSHLVLDIDVPDTIASHFPNIIHPFLEKNDLNMGNIDHLIFHPGGKKILQTVEDLFYDLGKNTFFIKDSSGNLITCSQDLLCKCVSVYEFVLHPGYSAPIRDSWVIMVTSKLYNLVVYTMTYIP